MRSVLVLCMGILCGLALMWGIRQSLRPTSLLRIPRAYTDIFRSKSPVVILPSSEEKPKKRRAEQSKKKKIVEEEEEEGEEEEENEAVEEEVEEAVVKKKRSTSSKSASKSSKKLELAQKEEEEEGEEEIPPKKQALIEEDEEEGEEEEVVKKVAKPSKKKSDGKPKKISRRHLGKLAGQEPNPLGFVDPKTGKLPDAAFVEPSPPEEGRLEGLSSPKKKVSVPIPPPPQGGGPKPAVKEIQPAPARSPLPKMFKTEDDIPEFCENPERFPDDLESIEWHIIEDDEVDPVAYPCHLANISHWALKYWYNLDKVKICTHDPLIDTVISDHLHKWQFWGSPDEWMVLLGSGPCTPERPYMLDIGSNLGIFSLIGADRGCHALAFEPLSENIHRIHQSMKVNGYDGRIMLAQHAVGKSFKEVSVGFRPSNPGASGIDLGGSKSETVLQITIDALLLGKNPPVFPGAKEKGLPPLTGQYINFVKVDTEGYDVAVVHGIVRTFVEGKVPLMLIEFGPGDAEGTAGCHSVEFVEFMYKNGYALWEWGYRVPLEKLTKENIPEAISGTGRRVFEAWFIRDDYVDSISFLSGDGRMKLKSEST